MRRALWIIGVVVAAGLVVLGSATGADWLAVVGVLVFVVVGTWPLELRRRGLWRYTWGTDKKTPTDQHG